MRTRHHSHSRTARIRRFARGLLCAAVATATVVGAGAAAADPTPVPAAANCPRWTALLVPGTWETTLAADPARPVGMLAPVAQGLAARYGSDIDVRTLAYTADAAPYTTSQTQGAQALTATLARLCSGTRVVLAGYSQGADIVGDLATAIGNNRGPIPASRVVAVGLLSDPRRDPATAQLGDPVSGQGIAGPRSQDFGVLTDRVRSVCAEGDLYCSTSPQASPALAAVGRAVTSIPAPAEGDPAPAADRPPAGTVAPTTSTSLPGSTSAAVPSAGTGTAGTLPASTGQLDPSQVLAQVVTVLGGLSGFAANVPAIVNDLAQLTALVATGDIPGLHRVAGDLNNQFNPLVRMVAGIDLHLVARALTLAAPLDPSGWVGVAAQIVRLLAGLDIARIATDIGQAQEIAWNALQKLAVGDPLAAVLTLSGVVPVATDILAATASAFTGTQFGSLADTYTASRATDTALGDLVRQGSDAARFAATGVHANGYTTATTALLDWLEHAIDHTN
ncbi:cutinase family protein [Nocardia anaemiae]|uniref:cutinase family protein n=1 Tax=Nocardia anaemiae TaxID=263910 RepID=UPI0007A4793B|nr:cutinase family protein [Nocardia anaemiae]